MYITYKVMLLPNKKQQARLFEFAGTARFAYNWALEQEEKAFKKDSSFIKDTELRKQFTVLKQSNNCSWLYNISSAVPKQAIKDLCSGYKSFFNHNTHHPVFKSKKETKQSFAQDSKKIKITDTHIKLEKLTLDRRFNKQSFNWIKLAEKARIPYGDDIVYYNPRIKYDGLHWWLTVAIDKMVDNEEFKTDNIRDIDKLQGIGIDLGVQSLAICSNHQVYKNINKTPKIQFLEKRKKRLQTKYNRQYSYNKRHNICYLTNNMKKTHKLLLKTLNIITNIRNNHINQVISNIINREPMFIVAETLNIKNMIKNHSLSKSIQDQALHTFKLKLQYKCAINNIKFISADRWFPSSKRCSCCGHINKSLTLYDRTYICPECGVRIDRDINASINLEKYGKSLIVFNNIINGMYPVLMGNLSLWSIKQFNKINLLRYIEEGMNLEESVRVQ